MVTADRAASPVAGVIAEVRAGGSHRRSVVGERTLTSVPKGDVVTLRDGPESGSRLVDVNWHGVIVRMSVTDLLEHTTMLFTVAT